MSIHAFFNHGNLSFVVNFANMDEFANYEFASRGNTSWKAKTY